MKTNGRKDKSSNGASVADELIRQVSESVIARSTGRKNRKGKKGALPESLQPQVLTSKPEPAPVVAPAAPPPAAPAPAPDIKVSAPAAPATPAVISRPPAHAEAAPVVAKSSGSGGAIIDTPPARKPETPVITINSKPASKPVEPVTPVVTPAEAKKTPAALAIFCYLEADSLIGQYITYTASALAERGSQVHLFTQAEFPGCSKQVKQHPLGDCSGPDLLAGAAEFTKRAHAAFEKQFKVGSFVVALGFEWSGAEVLPLLVRERHVPAIISLHSIESQRSDLSSELSQKILQLELDAIKAAGTVLIHNPAVGDAIGQRLPEARERLVFSETAFPYKEFESKLDAGEVKARFQIGPIDPTVLYIGDFDDRHGPDLLMKAAAPLLRNHKQVRFVFVGDGPLQWPMRVHARYLLLEYAVRFTGHLEGKPLQELVAAADVVCVPSRSKTEEWPVLAAWAAKKPLVTTHQMAGSFLQHEQDAVLIYSNENSVVWGVERVLFDEGLRTRLGENGYRKLVEHYGWNRVAGQLEKLVAARVGATA